MGLAGTVDVVGVVAVARDEAEVLFASDRCADSGGTHGVPPKELELDCILGIKRERGGFGQAAFFFLPLPIALAPA